MREKLELLGCLAALGVLLLCSADTARAVREGLALCAGSVIPALFPFLAVSGLLTALDAGAAPGRGRMLLARVLDKLELARNRGVPAHTSFLSPGERAAVEDLLRLCGPTRSLFWGGYPDAERTACVFLPDWQEPEDNYSGYFSD